MNTARKTKVSFEEMPNMMAELLDEMRALTDRVKRMETAEVTKTFSGREILTTMEVANILKVARITVYRMANRGDIPCYRNGKHLMFYRDEIMEWVNSGKTNGHLLPIMTADGYMPSRMAR
jgi:excisionase family DNA binding protein